MNADSPRSPTQTPPPEQPTGSNVREAERSSHSPLNRTERRVTKTMITYIVIAIVIGSVMAAILFRNWTLMIIALIVFIPYALLLSAPLWLARTTHAAQKKKQP